MRPRLLADRRGATAIEFGLLAPVFLLLLFGLIEMGRLLWVKQVLTETAYSAARCGALASPCKTQGDIRSFAAARGARWGIRIDASLIDYAAAATCDGNAGSVQVTIRYAFASPLSGFIAALPQDVQAHGCFPKLS
ncbi:TadE/TadG family type IV pilus assembly protein [Sphingomonas pituitosa]|uniref:TadE/TadG family type IV pilus assembly protein n=1 Tax=Sphingomonas pituitosa TaxID=99597 RepID=UPI001FDFEDDF|nr:TadE/TadG family type IV pilus assembly protein [Sphingomonas pituitosa]